MVDIITFIKNLVSGDSTVNYEIIHGEEIKSTDLSFLYDYKNDFSTFNIAKAYLGFAKRDIKSYNNRIDSTEKRGALLHILRSNYFAYHIINNNVNINSIYEKLRSKKTIINAYKDINILFFIVNQEEEITNKLRKELTDLHNKNKITRYLKPEIQNIITKKLKEILNISIYELPLEDVHYYNENINFKY
jgi:hypothetical protein